MNFVKLNDRASPWSCNSLKSGHEYGAGGAFLHVCTRGIDFPAEILVMNTSVNSIIATEQYKSSKFVDITPKYN